MPNDAQDGSDGEKDIRHHVMFNNDERNQRDDEKNGSDSDEDYAGLGPHLPWSATRRPKPEPLPP